MSGGAILVILFFAIIICFLLYNSIHRQGYHKAFAMLEAKYGSINAYKQKIESQISQQKKEFENNRDVILHQMREQITKQVIDEQQNTIRNMRYEFDMEMSVKKRDVERNILAQRSSAEHELKKAKSDLGLIISRHESLIAVINEFAKGFVVGRKWIAKCVADIEMSKYALTEYQRERAPKTTEKLALLKKEHRDLIARYKFLEAQLNSYKEYFPFLDDYEELILEEIIDLSLFSEDGGSGDIDRAQLFLDVKEYESLSISERYQLALDRYCQRSKNNWEVGLCYERYLGYLYEREGWDVTYFGASKKLEDMGRDLICQKNNIAHIVQAKCWSKSKTIHEKHIFQLYGTTLLFELGNPSKTIIPIFATTTSLSDVATEAAKRLGVMVRYEPLSLLYPMIKCNISGRDGEKIYHLPFDQQYDKVKIDREGEFYACTVAEAEKKGFRRAKRYLGGRT